MTGVIYRVRRVRHREQEGCRPRTWLTALKSLTEFVRGRNEGLFQVLACLARSLLVWTAYDTVKSASGRLRRSIRELGLFEIRVT
jgi:hypothetical protein